MSLHARAWVRGAKVRVHGACGGARAHATHPLPEAHLTPMPLQVARATKNTSIGRNFFPPAPKICCAAAMSMGWRSPTTLSRFSTSWSMSSATGRRISAMSTDSDLSRASVVNAATSSFTGLITWHRTAERRCRPTRLGHCGTPTFALRGATGDIIQLFHRLAHDKDSRRMSTPRQPALEHRTLRYLSLIHISEPTRPY